MERSDLPGMPATANETASFEPSAALADATEIVERIAADRVAAEEVRLRCRAEGLPTLPPDERVAPLLDADERLHAIRHAALLDRREPAPGVRAAPGVAGELYVTSRRLLLLGRLTLTFELDAIDDSLLSGERLLLIFRGGHGVMLQVAQPRQLWVVIGAARAAAKRRSAAAG